MEVAASLAIAPLVFAVLFAVGVVRGRRGHDVRQRRMFSAGLVGFLMLPVWFLALASLFAQLMFASLASVAGVVWMITSVVLVAAALLIGFNMRGHH